MDTAQWPLDLGAKPVEETAGNACPKEGRKARGHSRSDQGLNCPRCASPNTKFCYYNNYSLSQPRYFCKTCRRYWTQGGSLRNVPIGGGSRKNNIKIRSSSSSSKINLTDQSPSNMHLQTRDLDPGFEMDDQPQLQLPNFDRHQMKITDPSPSSRSSHLLKNGLASSSRPGFDYAAGSFMPMNYIIDPNTKYTVYSSSGFPLPADQYKPCLSFSLDGFGTQFGGNFDEATDHQKLVFPHEDFSNKPEVSRNANDAHEPDRDQAGYWNGMISGGGGSW